MNISPRILKEARAQASFQANRMQTAYQTKRAKSWDDLARQFQIVIPDNFSSQEYSWGNISLFLSYWRNSFEARLQAAVEAPRASKIKIASSTRAFGGITLFPEQLGVFLALKQFYEQGGKAALIDWLMGRGKTYLAAALIKDDIDNGILSKPEHSWRPHPYIIFTPKGVVESFKRVLEEAGLGDYVSRRKIYVISDAEFTTSLGDIFCNEEEDIITGDKRFKWNPALIPIRAFVDECHRYVRWESTRTKKLMALIETRYPQFTFMSATPGEKVNDMLAFVTACNTNFMGMHVTKDNYKFFAELMGKDPHKPNIEAMGRLRTVLSKHIFSLPYVKPKFKAINRIQLVSFESDQARKVYDTAHARYIEACRKSGKNTLWGQFEKLIALNNYRKTVEPLRAWYLADQAGTLFQQGQYAVGIGCAFKETICEVAFRLTDRFGVKRSDIALVWGGKREYRSDELLSDAELESVLANPNVDELIHNRALMKRIRLTLRYKQDQIEHMEDQEQQAFRHAKLKELGLLGKQGDNNRQVEVDRFQDGSAKILLFTIASGGIGLSFDRCREELLPRKAYFTPLYNGKEFQQGLGRFVRRASLSDAEQVICMMQDTVEEWHVVPILDVKLKSTAAVTARSMDIIDLLTKDAPVARPRVTVRSIEEAAKDAEADDTIVTDFRKDDDDDDDELENPDDLTKDL